MNKSLFLASRDDQHFKMTYLVAFGIDGESDIWK